MDWDKLASRIQNLATKAYGRVYRKDIVDEEMVETADGDSVKAYWYEKDSPVFGQATPFGTMILNRTRLSGMSERVHELVIQHEQGHLRRNSVARGALYGLLIWAAVGIVALLKIGAWLALTPTAQVPVLPIGVCLGVIFSFGVALRIEETLADLHALRVLGEDDFLAAYEEVSVPDTESIIHRMLKRLFYTRPTRTVRLHRQLDRTGIYALLNRARAIIS